MRNKRICVNKIGAAGLYYLLPIVNKVIDEYPDHNYLFIVSAAGPKESIAGKKDGITRSLIKIYHSLIGYSLDEENRKQSVNTELTYIRDIHFHLINHILNKDKTKATDDFLHWFNLLVREIEDLDIGSIRRMRHEILYSRIVKFGELMSSAIVSASLNECSINNYLFDARDCIITKHFSYDNQYKEVHIDYDISKKLISLRTEQIFNEHNIAVTQGYIGVDHEGTDTTLPLNGSDWTASSFAKACNAPIVNYFKDVDGVLPYVETMTNQQYTDRFRNSEQYPVFPMAIEDLVGIPTYVRSFKNLNNKGTLIL